MKWQPKHDHAGYPEEEDVEAGNGNCVDRSGEIGRMAGQPKTDIGKGR